MEQKILIIQIPKPETPEQTNPVHVKHANPVHQKRRRKSRLPVLYAACLILCGVIYIQYLQNIVPDKIYDPISENQSSVKTDPKTAGGVLIADPITDEKIIQDPDTPDPEQNPETIPEQNQKTAPEPDPEPVSDPKPAEQPEPVPEPDPEPVSEPTPEPEPVPKPEPEPVKQPEPEPKSNLNATTAEIKELALMCVAEAEGESEYGQRLVIDTALNRKDAKGWPNSIMGVLHQKSQYSSFSNGRIYRCTVTDYYINLVKSELQSRTSHQVYYFRTGHYSEYGTRLFKVGHHYFSGK